MEEASNFITEDMKVTTLPEDISLPKDNDAEAEKPCSRLCRSSLVVRHALYPLDWLMKISGMSYGSSCPLNTRIGVLHKIQRAHTIFIGIAICIASLRFIPLFFTKKTYPTFIQIEYLVWHMKCMVQEIFCIYICCRYGRKVSRLQGLIWEYDMLLLSYKNTVRKADRKFIRMARIILGLMFLVLLTNIAMLSASFFSPSMADMGTANPLIHPFQPTILSKTIFLIITIYFSVAWVLPVILYCILCLALCLVFDQFCFSLKDLECKSVKKRIAYIRGEYLKLQQLSSCTDECVGFMALCVYFLDVVLFCFHMYHLVFHATNPLQKLVPGFWTFVSVCNLFFMSVCASRVVDKGQKIYSFVSKMDTYNIDLESHAQLMMLLQDMAIDPPALTIWKLVPLYKSIVISVFVSLITYFTLLIQFKA